MKPKPSHARNPNLFDWLYMCIPTTALQTQENNAFVGAEPKFWECSENWETKDGTAAKSAPCGNDRAFFREVCVFYLCLFMKMWSQMCLPHRATTTTLWNRTSHQFQSSIFMYEDNW